MNAAREVHRAWLVDLDGTLYRPGPVKLLMGAELALLGPRHLGAIRAFRHEHEALRAEAHAGAQAGGDSPFGVQLERAARARGMPVEELERIVREWMVQRPGKWIRRFRRVQLLAEIASFRAGGGRTALVSDYPATEKLAALGATSWFEVVVSNGEPGGPRRLKPDPDGYRRAAEQLGVEPAECLVLGDRDDADGEAARRAGMDFRLVS